MPSSAFAFDDFQLDVASKRLLRGGTPVPLTIRQFDLLRTFVSRPGELLPKDVLIRVAWQDVAVTDNSLTQAILQLRRTLDAKNVERYIETARRRGYRFVAPVTRLASAQSGADFDALVAPHRAFLEGTAALEKLERTAIAQARTAFESLLMRHPDEASFHVGLANARLLQFEMTRMDAEPDTESLEVALAHARAAIHLNADHGEAWATLGFVVERTGNHLDALAALRRAVKLEPDNWRHHLRLAFCSWCEERLRAARRTLALLPGCPLAHLLAATVHVARGALGEAERDVDAGLTSMSGHSTPPGPARFPAVGLHWLKGLLCLARGADDEAMAAFERELALEGSGHPYARECCANTWYAIGALRLRRKDETGARAAFKEAIARVGRHSTATAALAVLADSGRGAASPAVAPAASVEAALASAVMLIAAADVGAAVARVSEAMAAAPPGNAGWFVPIEPMLNVQRDPASWISVLTRVRDRAM